MNESTAQRSSLRIARSPHDSVLAVLTLLLIIGFVTTSLASYFASRNAIRQSIIDTELPLTSDNAYSEIQRDLIQPIVISTMMAHDTFLRDWVLSGEGDVRQVTNYLHEIGRQYGTVTAFFISDRTHRYYQTNGVLKTVSTASAHDKWYFSMRTLAEPYTVEVDADEANRGELTVFINSRVFDYEGALIGVTGVGINVKSIRELIDTYKRRFDRNVYFVGEDGRIVLTGSAGGPLGEHAGDRLANNTEFGHLFAGRRHTLSDNFEYRANGSSHFANVRYIPELRWYLVVDKSESGPLAGVRQALYMNLLVCGLTIVVALFLMTLVLRRYRKQIRVAENERYGALSSLAHDIRSPHSSILALIDLQRGATKRLPEPEFFSRIESYTRRASELADDFVQLARAETQRYSLERTNIGDVLLEAMDEIAPRAQRKQIAVTFAASDDICFALADRTLLMRTLINLLDNAIKYSPAGSRVDCAVKRLGARVECAVRDYGYGIAPEAQLRLFQRFARFRVEGQPEEEGVGLGLVFVKTVVARHGGSVRVDSAPGRGTTMEIALPAA
ncbi:sensor histidine kinase [Paraburkholderia solisilvae]|uniref:histidine kinase n=1 Tax=Paraburkholderia solisilvae TaxID=624376 RepID=A0A6J5DKK1_9BURK|nr:ATP-binding protein [Paraburkholderia solisilvae]CAB3753545.1 Adaptive-response sensory-kinase SasA [Paraburkholderia solisilvae]